MLVWAQAQRRGLPAQAALPPARAGRRWLDLGRQRLWAGLSVLGRLVAFRPLRIQYSTPDAENREVGAYRVLAFYLVRPVLRPVREAAIHKAWCRSHNLVGRIWVSRRGLNVQISGQEDDCRGYADFVARRFSGGKMLCRMDPVAEPAFPKLRVKAKKLVSLKQELSQCLDMSDRGEDLEPQLWRERLQGLANGEPGVLLDLRNDYEWDLGHFDRAPRPNTEEMKAMDFESLGLSEDDQETPLYMYCTGGIRCEFFGAALRRRGFKQVFKLKGGVQHYGNTVGADGWQGRLLVFDERGSVPVGRARPCACTCGRPAEEFWNCESCNGRMVTCATCRSQLAGCCRKCRSDDHDGNWNADEKG